MCVCVCQRAISRYHIRAIERQFFERTAGAKRSTRACAWCVGPAPITIDLIKTQLNRPAIQSGIHTANRGIFVDDDHSAANELGSRILRTRAARAVRSEVLVYVGQTPY